MTWITGIGIGTLVVICFLLKAIELQSGSYTTWTVGGPENITRVRLHGYTKDILGIFQRTSWKKYQWVGTADGDTEVAANWKLVDSGSNWGPLGKCPHTLDSAFDEINHKELS